MKLIAEVKKASPFKGVLKHDLDPVKQALAYQRLGADAISVVTAADFAGEAKWVKEIKKEVNLPILRKDFFREWGQLNRAKDEGADWVLLLANQLGIDALETLIDCAYKSELVPIVEVFQPNDILKVSRATLENGHSPAVLINNRCLESGFTNLENTFRLYPDVPCRFPVIAGSGISEPSHVNRLRELGVDWVLVGELFMTSTNLEESFKIFKP
jgi:indole-3-glycerol phosphate synthase